MEKAKTSERLISVLIGATAATIVGKKFYEKSTNTILGVIITIGTFVLVDSLVVSLLIDNRLKK